jgi:hypothetical protein
MFVLKGPRYDLLRAGEVELFSGRAFFGSGPDEERETHVVITYNGEAVFLQAQGYPSGVIRDHHFEVYIPSLNAAVDVLLTQSGGAETSGVVTPVAFGTDAVSAMDFQVANLPYFNGTLQMQANGWHVTIRPVADGRERERALALRGGVAVTAYGQLTNDAGAFSAHDGESVLGLVTWLLSFGFGDRAAVLMPVGTDTSGTATWHQWADPLLESYKGRLHWLPRRRAYHLQDVFPRLINLWFGQSAWDEPGLWVPLQFYLEAARGLLETRIVLAQAAVEHLAWRRLVLDGDVPRDEFRRYSGARRIRELLNLCGIPADLHPRLSAALDGLPTTEHVVDGPDAVTWVRNSIVHARRMDLLLQHDKDYAMPVLQHMLWYFEMAMLQLLGYDGPYMDRREGGVWEDSVSIVPWVSDRIDLPD